jgi:large subunit ribosomal protein L1
MRHLGKNYKKALELIRGQEAVGIAEAAKLVKESSTVKFDATAELHMGLYIDPKKADQLVRSTVVLPHGTGKKLKIAAVVSDDKVKEAKEAGATAAGLEDLIAEFEGGKFDYDVVVATPDVMKHLGKVAKTLGQKGLMPNPKSGTVTTDVAKAIEELSRGRVEFRNDKEGNLHTVFGKVSFKVEELENNLRTLLNAIRDAKPSGVKGTFIKSITVCTTMGPGIPMDVTKTLSDLKK